MSVAKRFFESVANVRTQLALGIREKREALGITPEELDSRCLFGTEEDLPKCVDFERDPQRMSPFVFSLASFALDLKLDQVLKADLSDPQDLAWVLDHIKSSKPRLAAAEGGPDAKRHLPPEEWAAVYVLMKALEETEHVST